MPVSESRASASIVKDGIVEAGDRKKFLEQKDEKPVGELAKYGNEDTQNSSITESFNKAQKDAAAKINNVKKDINNKLSGLTPEKLISGMGTAFNMNVAPINAVLGVTKKILCWDGNIDFTLQDLINALDFKFDFLRTWSICDRQGLSNPLDNLLRSISRMENELSQLKNLDKRLLNNLKSSIKGFINNCGLPRNLAECMLNSAFLNTAEKYRSRASLKALKDIAKFLNPDICKKSDAGVPTKIKHVDKIAMTPFVSGIANYPREIMISCLITLITNEDIDPELVIAALMESCHDVDNKNTVKLLEMLAIAKVLKEAGNNKKARRNKVGDINTLLINSGGSVDAIMDKVVSVNDIDGTIDKSTLLGVVDDTTITSKPPLDPKVVLKNMKDDYTTSGDVSKDLKHVKKMLTIAIPGFNPSKNIGSIAESDTMGYLLEQTEPNKTREFAITNNNEMVGSANTNILKLNNNDDAYFDAFIVREMERGMDTEFAI